MTTNDENSLTDGRREQVKQALEVVLQWTQGQPSIRGLALVGSHARRQARPDSDVDLVFLVDDPDQFRVDAAWLTEIDWNSVTMRPVAHRDAQYGVLWARHVQLDNDLEIEFGFAPRSWADSPIDPGTWQVVKGWSTHPL